MRPGARAALGALGLALAALPAGAIAQERPSVLQVPLDFDQTDLAGGEASAAARLHLPPGLAVRDARLVVGYANALAGDPRFSSLEVVADGRPLVRLPLVGAQEPIQAEIDVPSRLIGPGALDLTFVARQRHRDTCSREAHERLWVRLDPEPSVLELEVGDTSTAPGLGGLEALLANSLIDGRTLQIATTRPADDPDVLAWGGLASEAVALRRPERPLQIRHVRLPDRPTGDARAIAAPAPVLYLGTLAELGALLPPDLPSGADQGLIALLPLDPGARPGTFALVASGRDAAAVQAALETLARPTRWPEGLMAAVPALAPPSSPEPAEETTVTPGDVTLAELGYTSRDVPLGFTGTLEVPFVMPDDSYAGDGQRVRVHLDIAYGAGLAPTSSLIVRVNGAPWNRVRLDEADGGIVEDATIDLPMGLFPPGPNVIAFEPILHPATPELCATVGDQPMFTLFEDSRIEIPAFARLARQPDLHLFGATGFPYGGRPGGLELVLGSADPITIASAWMLRGRLAAARGGALGPVRTSFARGSGSGDLLVVGAVPDLPQAVVRDAPVPLLFLTERSVDVAHATDSGTTTKSETGPGAARASWQQRLGVNQMRPARDWLGRLTDRIVGAARAVPRVAEPAAPSFEQLYPGDERARAGTIVAFRSPFAEERTATVVTAASRSALAAAVNELVRPAVWNRLDGDLTVWTPDGDAVRSRRVAPMFLASPIEWSAGELILLGRAHFARNPTHWLVLVFGMLVVLAGVTALALRRRTPA